MRPLAFAMALALGTTDAHAAPEPAAATLPALTAAMALTADDEDEWADEDWSDEGWDDDDSAWEEEEDQPGGEQSRVDDDTALASADGGDADVESEVAAIDPDSGFVEDFTDDSWAPDLDEAALGEETIAVDDSYGEDWAWDVTSVQEADGGIEDTDQREIEDSPSVGGMLVLSGGPRGGGQPQRAQADGEDVPYAFGGRPVAAGAVPWQAQIFDPGAPADPAHPRPGWMLQHNCGGALIAEGWVLTAAHCISQNAVDLGFKVRLGAQDLSQGDGYVYRIERIVRHSQYSRSNNIAQPPNMYANDIALLRIVPESPNQRPDPQRVRPIALNRQPLQGGTPVSVTGWGAVGNGDLQKANARIVRVDLRMMDNATCTARPGRAGKIGPGVFCAADPRQSTCRGDSGGPVVPTYRAPVLVGVVSWGSSRCGGDGRPSVYTRVDQFIDWIEEAMRLPAQRNALP